MPRHNLNSDLEGGASNKVGASAPKYKKAPDAPKRFKSAFIIFSAEKHKEIKDGLALKGRSEKTTDIAKLVSEAWREMQPEEKESWEKKARKDKARYEVEKAMYKGPWKIPANKRTPKDPTAPKRPMSAFLAFSNKRRAALKRENPDATNADLSKMLSRSWKEAPDDVRKKYMDEEAALRNHYKVEMAKWRKKVAEEKKLERQEREAMAMQAAETRQPGDNVAQQPIPAAAPDPRQYARIDNMSGPPAVQHMPHQPPPQDMGPAPGGMYGNPYGMGEYGGYGGMPQGGPGGYPNLMGGNPFGGSQSLMNGPASQQHLISHLFNQQFQQGNPQSQRGGLNLYGQGGQGMQGGQQGYGGYGGMGDMPPHQQRGMPVSHQQHMGHGGGNMGVPGGYGMHGMGNEYPGRDDMGNDMVKRDDHHHYGNLM